jgi:hypothetical protein
MKYLEKKQIQQPSIVVFARLDTEPVQHAERHDQRNQDDREHPFGVMDGAQLVANLYLGSVCEGKGQVSTCAA